MATTPLRRVVGALTALLVAVLGTVGLAGPASAEEGYKYWNYFHLTDGAWAFSQTGPSGATPEDGAVEGWRYGTSTTSQGIMPRADLSEVTFETVCADEQAADGEKRVAVLIDYGIEDQTAPAPRAACAVVPADANGQQVIESVADVRVQDGMTCALDGYPASGCGEPVGDAQVPASEEPVAFDLPASGNGSGDAAAAASDSAQDDSGSGLLWPLVGVAAVAVLIAVAAVVMNRRRQSVV